MPDEKQTYFSLFFASIFPQKEAVKSPYHVHHPCIKSIICFPADNTVAIPVDHGCQIQGPPPDGNIGKSMDHDWFVLSITALRRR